MGRLKMHDMKMRHKTAKLKNARQSVWKA